MLHPFKECVGIELLEGLHTMSNDTEIQYENYFENKLNLNDYLFPYHKGHLPNLDFINGNFFRHDWSNASMVFSNSTCYDKKVMDELFQKANYLKKGSIFINTTTLMPKKYKDNWHYVTPFSRLMSWGIGKIYIYKRK